MDATRDLPAELWIVSASAGAPVVVLDFETIFELGFRALVLVVAGLVLVVEVLGSTVEVVGVPKGLLLLRSARPMSGWRSAAAGEKASSSVLWCAALPMTNTAVKNTISPMANCWPLLSRRHRETTRETTIASFDIAGEAWLRLRLPACYWLLAATQPATSCGEHNVGDCCRRCSTSRPGAVRRMLWRNLGKRSGFRFRAWSRCRWKWYKHTST